MSAAGGTQHCLLCSGSLPCLMVPPPERACAPLHSCPAMFTPAWAERGSQLLLLQGGAADPRHAPGCQALLVRAPAADLRRCAAALAPRAQQRLSSTPAGWQPPHLQGRQRRQQQAAPPAAGSTRQAAHRAISRAQHEVGQVVQLGQLGQGTAGDDCLDAPGDPAGRAVDAVVAQAQPACLGVVGKQHHALQSSSSVSFQLGRQ